MTKGSNIIQAPIRESFKDTSYKLAKALHFNKCSREYFEMLRLDAKGETKLLFQNCIQRLDWVYHNIYDRLSENSREILRTEMQDSLAFDEIMNQLILLQPEQRSLIENIISALNKGETIEVALPNTY